ncbi:MAG TPA: PVC-type heme-binding CxxCH protein [Tepidisphaeraceae bacterium]|jgi:putative membrane-bound dehydrogenase-like protein|nr:PVC-type heme-binding CxxCH protein [Tepidisphaeraceae bacterium]
MKFPLPRVVAASVIALAATSTLAADNIFDAKYDKLATTLPKTAPNWKVELVTAPPVLHWPSVVECAPDGRIFIAEDPMDMPGPANKPGDRVLCIHPDGQVTVFADHLYAVFGLRYIDGKLYIHHSPKFTVYTDDNGVGKDPKDIWDSDCIATWGGGSLNDHIPSNVRLGMDGWLYMSTGDKGIYNCKSNIDGSKIEIHGGGVVRMRPDGSHLQVYSSGTRNHLDLALNAEDEIFTYDNTDDGLGWWTRYTHMVDGGYYGYPHDYRPEESNVADMAWYRKTKGTLPYRPWTLWRIDETGGGSAVGAVGYNEDALPEEYRGNSFNCEWGKSLLQRFHTVRDGGTYKIEKMENILFNGPDFHPLGITVTPDGTGFYIADWQMGGWGTKKEQGRLLKLTYTGEMHPAPRPAWYIPAAEGQKFEATLPQLIAGLSHPAECVRLVAERRVAEHGKEAIPALVALLNDAKAPPYGRWHAIWTLDMIDGGKAARSAILAVAKDDKAEMSVRMQAVRQLGTCQAADATDACVSLLNNDNAAMRFRAATALGRIGNPAAIAPLLNKLDEKDLFTHFADFTALKRIGLADAKAWPAIIKGFDSTNPAIRAGAGLALHEVFDKALVDALAAFIADKANSADARAAAMAALAPLHRQRPAWDGKWWGTQPQRTPLPPKTVEWAGTPVVLAAIQDGLKDSEPAVRKASLDALQIAPDPAAVGALVSMFNAESDANVKKAILNALASAKSPDAMSIVTQILKAAKQHPDLVPEAATVAEGIATTAAIDALISLADSDSSPASLTAAFESLGRLRAKKAIPVLARQAGNANVEVATAAASALGAIGGRDGATALLPIVQDKRPEVRKAAVVALGNTQDSSAVPALIAASKDPETQTLAITALTKHPDAKAADAYLDGLGSNDAGLRSLCRKAIEQISAAALPVAEARLDNGPPLSKTAIAELQRIYAKNEPIKNWQIIGPFPIDAPDSLKAASVTDLRHLPTDLKSADKKSLAWKKTGSTREGFVDLAAQFEPHEHVYAYAVAELNSPLDRDMTFAMGHDDGLALWVNGSKVYEDLGNHGWEADQFHAAGHLVKGRNIIIAKITQDAGPWGFSVSYAGEHKGKLFEMDTKSTDVKTYDAFAVGHDGDASRGAALFQNAQGLGCIKCHTVSGKGGNVGPDLSAVATKYNRAQLIESVLYPSKQIEPGYEQTMIRTKDGNVSAGVVRNETDKDVTMYDSAANKIVIRKADINVRKISPVSVMPEGLQAALTHQQFADLIAYLQSLKQTPKK